MDSWLLTQRSRAGRIWAGQPAEAIQGAVIFNTKNIYLNTCLGSNSELKITRGSGMAMFGGMAHTNYFCAFTCPAHGMPRAEYGPNRIWCSNMAPLSQAGGLRRDRWRGFKLLGYMWRLTISYSLLDRQYNYVPQFN
jgi:hypothetical protein